MTSAFASLPPPFRLDSTDPRASARKFLERALVLSALIHLSVVGAFRAVEERVPPEEVEVRAFPGPFRGTYVCPPPAPPAKWRPAHPTSETGTFFPVPKKPDFEILTGRQEPTADPGEVAGNTPSDNGRMTERVLPPPPDVPQVFPYADTPPQPISTPKPVYPEWAKEAGIEGKVLLRAFVGADGIVKKVVVVSGPSGLSEEAYKAVLRWTFKPGLANKMPVEVWVEIPVVFRL